MSLESAKKFYDDLHNEESELDLEKLSTIEPTEMKPYINSFGYDFTQEELRQVLLDEGAPISMDEAEMISGGHLSKWGTVGAATGAVIAANILGRLILCIP